MKDEKKYSDILKHRIEKLKNIKDAGYEPYGYYFDKSHNINKVFKLPTGNEVTIAGRIVSFRKMGKASFAHIMDFSGKIQVYLKDSLLNYLSLHGLGSV